MPFGRHAAARSAAAELRPNGTSGRMRTLLVSVLVSALSCACSSSSSKEPSGNEPGKYAAPPAMTIDPNKSYKATIGAK